MNLKKYLSKSLMKFNYQLLCTNEIVLISINNKKILVVVAVTNRRQSTTNFGNENYDYYE